MKRLLVGDALLERDLDGRAVVVPYVAGRSATRLIEEVVARAG